MKALLILFYMIGLMVLSFFYLNDSFRYNYLDISRQTLEFALQSFFIFGGVFILLISKRSAKDENCSKKVR